MPRNAVKICGVRTAEGITWAHEAAARYIGLNFYGPSPRFIAFDQAAALAHMTPVGLAKVGLVVNEDNGFLDELTAQVPLDMIQCHGQETPERVAEIKSRYGLAVIKAVGIATAADLAAARAFDGVADQLLFDAKPNPDDPLPGGNGHAFSWPLLSGYEGKVPWLLAGGLTEGTVAEAIAQSGARQVDVSSGVESERGVKSQAKIAAFCAAAQAK